MPLNQKVLLKRKRVRAIVQLTSSSHQTTLVNLSATDCERTWVQLIVNTAPIKIPSRALDSTMNTVWVMLQQQTRFNMFPLRKLQFLMLQRTASEIFLKCWVGTTFYSHYNFQLSHLRSQRILKIKYNIFQSYIYGLFQ